MFGFDGKEREEIPIKCRLKFSGSKKRKIEFSLVNRNPTKCPKKVKLFFFTLIFYYIWKVVFFLYRFYRRFEASDKEPSVMPINAGAQILSV